MKSILLISVLLALLSVGCQPTPANYKTSSCASNSVFTMVDKGSSTTGIAAGAALGQHIRLVENMLVKKIMIRMGSGGMTNMIISFFKNFTSSDQTTFSDPVYHFTWIGNFSGVVQDFWITLPVPLLLERDIEYMIGLAPNSNITLGQSPDYGYDGIRTAYRPGTGPYNGWQNATDKSISIGFEGDSDCT